MVTVYISRDGATVFFDDDVFADFITLHRLGFFKVHIFTATNRCDRETHLL